MKKFFYRVATAFIRWRRDRIVRKALIMEYRVNQAALNDEEGR